MYRKHSNSINLIHSWAEICRADPCMTHMSAGLYGCTRITSITEQLDKAVEDVAPYAIAYLKWTNSTIMNAMSLKTLEKNHIVMIDSFVQALTKHAKLQGANHTPMSFFVDASDATIEHTATSYEKALCDKMLKDISRD